MKRHFFHIITITLLLVICLSLSGCNLLDDLLGSSSKKEAPPNNPSNNYIQPTPYPVAYNAVLEITRFACHNAEEDDYVTSSGQDEITFIYTIIETDRNGYAVHSASKGWGPFDIYRGDDYDTRYFDDLRINNIPAGHGVLITLSIVDIEDYTKAQNMMDTINRYANYVSYANMLNPEPYSKTAIEITHKILKYSGYALDIIDWADDDDTLADHIDVGEPNQVYNTLVGNGYLHNGWVFSGTINWDDFEYEVAYIVHLEPVFQ